MELKEVLLKLNHTLERIEMKMEADTESYRGLREAMDSFRDEIRSSQRRTAEALAIGRQNANKSLEASREFRKARLAGAGPVEHLNER